MPARPTRTNAADKVAHLPLSTSAEADLITGNSPPPPAPPNRPQPAAAAHRPAPSTPTTAGPSHPTTPQPTPPASGVRIRTEVFLPEHVVANAKALVRPTRTGARRTLSAAFALQAYIRAIDSLDLAVDLQGLDRGDDDRAVQRVLDALQQWKRRQP
jgi:hypothetical protein